ncbi:MAG: branched-chain amino acid transaminase [Thermoplasmata archaeon]|jgi:branched-chain amino acid aminotransferase|nr:branched-chain amino acid transaminase [Thermoplasmatales archaeon]PMP75673.1 MAG: branched chain amino acid aminotransferase [Aciduliprofundum sp.]HEU12928.1 branched-chain amino acid transaminase [Euryarchaeota archaeon]
MKEGLKVWLDGDFLNYDDAKVPILTHSLQYGSGIFEGIRAYRNERGTAVFRLHDHIRRFFNTAKIYRMQLKYSPDEISNAILDLLRMNRLDECYIRPFAFYNDDGIGLSPYGKRVSLFIGAVPFGKYLSRGNGAKCKTSTWKRINSGILPVQAKASGNYLNSLVANLEARSMGFDEAIMLGENGYIAEGPGENIFIVRDGTLITPPVESDILVGITRDSIIKIARSVGINTVERNIHREEIYIADEAFFVGTAAEITPIESVDNIVIGNGKVGDITSKLLKEYMDVVHGRNEKFISWLTQV